MESKERVTLWAQLGLHWTWLRGNDGHLKYLLWLTVDWGHPVFIQFYYLLPQLLHFETSDGFRTKLILQTLCTSCLFFSSFALRFHHCTSIIPHTPIYRAFKRTNSYLQIYLVKPWLISTVFHPTLRLFKDKTLEYLKILNSKNNKNKIKLKKKNLLVSFFDPKTLFT